MTSMKIDSFAKLPSSHALVFYLLDLARPILNEPPPPLILFNKLWNNNSTVHVNKQNQNKKKKSRQI